LSNMVQCGPATAGRFYVPLMSPTPRSKSRE
jgi:hypothetical protein